MIMGSNDKRKRVTVLGSFTYALAGIISALRAERNMQFHFVFSIAVIIFSILFSITKMEWIFILFAIGGMFALELMNTAIERVVDLVTSEYHPLAKQAKDIAAGAVLVYALLSAVTGVIIFLPYFLQLF